MSNNLFNKILLKIYQIIRLRIRKISSDIFKIVRNIPEFSTKISTNFLEMFIELAIL